MDPLAILIGILFLAAIYKNKEIKDDDNQDLMTFFGIFILFLIFGGLDFVLPARIGASPNMGMILSIQIGFAAVFVSTKGPIRIFSQVAILGLFLLLIVNSIAFS